MKNTRNVFKLFQVKEGKWKCFLDENSLNLGPETRTEGEVSSWKILKAFREIFLSFFPTKMWLGKPVVREKVKRKG